MTENSADVGTPAAAVTLISGPAAQLGESPLWLAESRALAYIDMIGGVLHRRDLETGDSTSTAFGPYLGSVVETRSGGLACATVDSIGILEDGVLKPAVRILDDDSLRLNDAACDPWGRLWVGSTSRTDEAGVGALHVWEPGASPTVVLDGMTQPNGIGWSPDRSAAYVVDSARSAVLTAETDPETGDIGSFQVFLSVEGGHPDGLAVAADGSIWLAVWDGSRIDRFAPDATHLGSIALPVTRPTSCAFVGDGRLIVTSARHGLDVADGSPDGRLLSSDVGVDGAPLGRLAV